MRNTALVVGTILMVAMVGAYMYYGGLSSGQSDAPAAVTPVVNTPPPPPAPVAVSFIELAQGTHSTVGRRTNYLITSSSELSALWKMVDAKGQIPTVDFKTSSVIAVFAGTKPTPGYTIAVADVTDSETRMVTITLSSPDSTCFLAQVLTAPYQIIVLPTTSLPLAHTDVTKKTSCLP